MPSADSRSANESALVTKRMYQFLRLLTFQMFFVIALLAYLIYRPQVGRYQLIPPQSLVAGKIYFLDTITGVPGSTSVEVRDRPPAPGTAD